MPKLVVLHNPFRTSERDILHVEPCRALAAVLEEHYGEAASIDEFHVSRNGIVIEPEEARNLIFGANDFVALVPRVGKGGGKKNVLGIIAGIALLTMTMGGGGGFLAGLFGGGSSGMMGMLLLGGLLMMGLGKVPKVDAPNLDGSSFEVDPEWDAGSPIMIQGKPMPITYGTVRVRTPQVLSQKITSNIRQQTLSLLLAGGEGPVDSVFDFRINDQPASNYYENKRDSQASRFSEIVPLSSSGYTSTRAAAGVANEITIGFEMPIGLYYKPAPGSPIEKAWVEIDIEYRDAGVGGAYTLYDTTRIEDAWTSRFEAFKKIIPPDPTKVYEFRITISDMMAGPTIAVYWTSILAWNNEGDVAFDYRLGTNNQTVMASFNDTFAEEGVGLELDTDYSTFQTSGNSNAGLEWTIQFPTGLGYAADDGSITESWVKIDIDYRLVGAGAWTVHKAAWELKTAVARELRFTTRVDNLAPGQYESRVRVDSSAHPFNMTRSMNKIRWEILSGIIYDDFERPGRVLVGMTALATDKLQGQIPRVSWTQTRAKVLVWDPSEDGGSGAYVEKDATNPAWICYDLIHRARTLKNNQTTLDEVQVRGDAASKIDFQAFSDWADFCDELVDGEKRCVANVLVDSAGALWEIVNRIAVTGRGGIVLRGQTWSAVWDEASSPVQLFTTGNITVDSLSGEFTSGNERANAIEATFINEDRNYERDTLTVYGDDWDQSDTTQQPTQVVLTGITDYRRAYREAAYRLRLNKYLKRQVSFRADVDAVACQVGDVVNLSHDLPRWGESGRLVACDTAATTLTLDREVTLDPAKTYEILVRLSDDSLVTKTIAVPATATTTNQVTVTVAFATAPAQYDLYAFGETDISAKPFRVTKIARTDDLHVEISALEYYPEIYTETMTVPTITYSTALPTVAGVYANVDFDAGGRAFLVISWTPPRDAYGGATVMVNGALVGRAGATETSLRHEIYEDGAYQVNVIGLSSSGAQLAGVQATIDVTALSIPIPQTVALTEDTYILRDGTVITDFDVTYTIDDTSFTTSGGARRYPVQRFACVHVEYDPDESGTWIDAGTVTSKTGFRLKNVKANGKVQVRLSVIDKFDAEGAAGLSAVTNITGKSALPDDVTGFDGAQDQYGIALSWTANDDPDIDVYEIRVGASWALGTVVFSGYTERARLNFTNSGTFTYWIKAKDTSGNYSANAATKAVVVSAPATPVATPTAINGGIKIDIVHTPNVDFDHYVVERKPTDGAWETINSNLRSTTWMDTDIATLGYTTTYEYRVTAVDRNGATGTASDATDATTAKKIETLDITTDQIVAKDFRSAADAGNGAVSGYRIHSGGIEGWNGATKNFCLDGATGTLYAVNACITGTVCATTGVIGGWTVAAGSLSAGNAALCCTGVGVFGTGNDVAVVSAADACYRIWTGHATAACAPFRVTKAGVLTACGGCFNGQITAASGNIGGWLIGATLLANCCAVLSSCGFIHLGDTSGGCDIVRMDAMDANYRLWAGHTTAASAPFRVSKAGALTATSATICGAVTATSGAIGGWGITAGTICSAGGCTILCCTGLISGGCYASGVRGWMIDANGNAEFNSATMRGAMRATVFQYQEVGAIGGQFLVANAGILRTTVTTPGTVGTCFSLDISDPEVGHAAQFTAGEILRVQTWNGSALASAWGTVCAVTDCATFYRYTVQLKNGTSQALPARAAVVSYGTGAAGGGVALVGAGTCAPYIDAFTTGSTPWTATTVQTRLGNLSGIAGLSGYGLYTNNGNIYGGVVRSNTFDATSGSCFGLAAGVLQLGGTGGGVSKCGMKWDGTLLSIYGCATITCGTIGGWTIASNMICSGDAGFSSSTGAFESVIWSGGTCLTATFFVRGDGYVRGACACLNEIYGCNLFYDTACIYGNVYGSIICASSCVTSQYGIFTTSQGTTAFYCCGLFNCIDACVCSTTPVSCASTRVQSPIICGSSCVASPTVCGTTGVVAGFTVCSPCMVASCCVAGPVVCALSFCIVNPTGGSVLHSCRGTSDFYIAQVTDGTAFLGMASCHALSFCTSSTIRGYIGCAGGWFLCTSIMTPFTCATVCSAAPIVYGSTCVSSPLILGSTCVCSPILCGSTCVYSPTICAALASFSNCIVMNSNYCTTETITLLNVNGISGEFTGIRFATCDLGYYTSAIRSIYTASSPNYLNPRLGFFTQNKNTYLCASLTEKVSILGSGYVGIGITNPLHLLHVAGNAYSCTCFCAPSLVATSGLTVCGVGAAANTISAACATGCALVVSNGHPSGGIGLLGCSASTAGFSGCFVGGSFVVSLSSTSQCFTVCNVTTGSGTAAHILATGQLVCQSSTRASKCCIAPWELPTDFLDRFEPARFLYRSGLNSGAPYLVGAIADDLAPWAPWAVRCDAQGNPATVSDTALATAALSGIKIERDERRREDAALWSCICALELALAKAR